jgi:hypothetical protein
MHSNQTLIRFAAGLGVTAIFAVGVLVAGQGADASDATNSDDIPAAPNNSDQDGLADGEHVGRIVAAHVAPDELVFRPVELLVGEEARAAAEADGAEAFDYYVRERTGDQAVVPVDGDVVVTAVDCSGGCVEAARATTARSLAPPTVQACTG